MSITIEQLAAELHTDAGVIADTARQLLTSSDEKVLTVAASSDDTEPVACLTDQAAAAIRTRLSTV